MVFLHCFKILITPKEFVPLLSTADGWINEQGFTESDKKFEFDIERKFTEPKWYATHFLGKESHVDYVGTDSESGNTIVASVVKSEQEGFIKAIVRTASGTFKHEIFVGHQNYEKISRKVVKKYVLAGTECETGILVKNVKDIRVLKEDTARETLRKLEEQEEPHQFKIGVFYVKEGQTDENDMFQNRT